MAISKTILMTAAGAIMSLASPVMAQSIYLDFENIAPYPNNNNVAIGGYYNGGTSSIGTSGPNLGVEFTTDAILLCLNTAGTTCSNTSRGGLGIPTSAFGALYFPSGTPTMNVAAGFDTGFSFVYSDPFAIGTTVSIYSDLNATGTVLASVTLPGTGNSACDPAISGGAVYCPFEAFSIAFGGTAKSVLFSGTANRQVFDDFTFGSTIVGGGVPEPASWALMIAGVGMVGGVARRRRSVTVRYA